MALQDMALPMAPGPPAMFVFLSEAVKDMWGMGYTCAIAPSSLVSSFITVILRVRKLSVSILKTERHWKPPGYGQSWFTSYTCAVFYFFRLSITSLYFCSFKLYSLTFSLPCLHHFHTPYFINPSRGKLVFCIWPILNIYKQWMSAVQHLGINCRPEASTLVKGSGRVENGWWLKC